MAVTWITWFSKARLQCFHAVCVSLTLRVSTMLWAKTSLKASAEVTIPSKGRQEDTLHQTTVKLPSLPSR